ncbi:MAG: isoleucine--tRNA ligase [Dehalococcoidia bacterium]|nr:isoleucine--tRNA ligase [Dehalococcoidia bacterium]
MGFRQVSSKVDFPRQEEAVLQFWKERRVFERSVEGRKNGPRFILYEGPPTANGKPGIHHVLSRVFKDIIPRYKVMRGYYAPRKAGWDTHGLPVELEVEKELGISTKPEIEQYGIGPFNARCKDSVFRYVKEWERLTDRVAFWVDLDSAYITFTSGYVESGWWAIKQLWDRGLVYQGMRVTPHCPRCVTTLSSHEVALGYKDDTKDPSVYVKFEVDRDDPRGTPAAQSLLAMSADMPLHFLAWTTTPWTLPGNTALAIKADADYALVELPADKKSGRGAERLVMAQALLGKALTGPHRVVTTVKGADLVGLRYKPLYDPFAYGVEVRGFARDRTLHPVRERPSAEGFGYAVIVGDFVSLDDGTGIVHIAPAFGEDDYHAGEENGLYFVQQVDTQGRLTGTYPFAGRFVKDADPLVMDDLKKRGLLYRRETIVHTYPFCWRCAAPLLYYAKTSWYIRTTAMKDRLVSANKEINWYPEHIKEGRFGEWLRNNVDWALSRERYWGTPLPVWECQDKACRQRECVGGVADLRARPGLKTLDASVLPEATLRSGDLDMHRPIVDAIAFACPKCGGTMRRVPEVIDCWFDSGMMPFAQWHYPFEKPDYIDEGLWFPADYICEAVDQTRGWFYSLHALSVLLKDRPCYRNVICLGHILDSKGEKMSKSKGNVVDPWSVINVHGADAIRWYLYTATPPGNSRRFSAELVGEGVRQFLLPLWNTYAFFTTYAAIDGFDPSRAKDPGPQTDLDRWALSELHRLTRDVTTFMDAYNPTDAGRRIQAFVDDLSNWYVRRSRRRFWKSESDVDKLAAHWTLYKCLTTLSKLLAPFTPFVAEEMYRNLVASVDSAAPESVHLADWPAADERAIDDKLDAATRLVMRVVSLGRAARQKAKLKVRQPLAQALVRVRAPEEREVMQRLAPQVMEELNVKEIKLMEDESAVQEFQVKPNLPVLGPRYGKEMGKVAAALAKAPAADVAAKARAGFDVAVGDYTLKPDELLITASDRPGYATASEGGYLVAVSTVVTPELADEGLARELVHRIQTLRKSAGFDIADQIVTHYQGGEAVQRVMRTHADYIRQETLSRELATSAAPHGGAYSEEHDVEGEKVTLAVRKVG